MIEDFLAPLAFDAGDLQIRMYRVEDAPIATPVINASHDHLRPWMVWSKPDQTVAETETLYRKFIASYLTDKDYTMGIWDQDEFLGGTGFHLRVGQRSWKCAEIGMWIAAHAAGRGVGTRALRAMLEWGFTAWEWERLVWKCDTKNLASARTAEKAGMTWECTQRSDAVGVNGDRRDTHQFVMLRSEFHAKA
ncbi:MAG: GNAT family N-acetyltransferase [Fimbriimonas sp.]